MFDSDPGDPAPTIREAIDALDGVPGPALAAALGALGPPTSGCTGFSDGAGSSGELGRLDPAELLRFTVACERMAAWAQALLLAGMAAFARRPLATLPPLNASAGIADRALGDVTDRECAVAELACALHLAPGTAEARLELGERLTRDLPATHAALLEGSIDLARARTLVEEIAAAGVARETTRDPASGGSGGLDPVTRDRVQGEVLGMAASSTAGQVRAATRRALHRVAPAAASRRHDRAMADRYVGIEPSPADGMGDLTALLPADALLTISTALDGLADALAEPRTADDPATTTASDAGSGADSRAGSGADARPRASAGSPDARTHRQRRADALTGVFASILAGDPLPVLRRHVPGDPVPSGDVRPGDRRGAVGAGEGRGGARGAPERAAVADRGDPDRRTPSAFGVMVSGWWLPPRLAQPRRGRRPHLVLTVPADPRSALDRSAAPSPDLDVAGDLAGYGPVPPPVVRRITEDAVEDSACPGSSGDDRSCADLTVVEVDPSTGFCRHVGSVERYRPSEDLRRRVQTSHSRCRFPGCRRPASQCDLDHVVPFDGGGATCVCNLLPLCRTHHRLKTTGGWIPRPVGSGGRAAHPDAQPGHGDSQVGAVAQPGHGDSQVGAVAQPDHGDSQVGADAQPGHADSRAGPLPGTLPRWESPALYGPIEWLGPMGNRYRADPDPLAPAPPGRPPEAAAQPPGDRRPEDPLPF